MSAVFFSHDDGVSADYNKMMVVCVSAVLL